MVACEGVGGGAVRIVVGVWLASGRCEGVNAILMWLASLWRTKKALQAQRQYGGRSSSLTSRFSGLSSGCPVQHGQPRRVAGHHARRGVERRWRRGMRHDGPPPGLRAPQNAHVGHAERQRPRGPHGRPTRQGRPADGRGAAARRHGLLRRAQRARRVPAPDAEQDGALLLRPRRRASPRGPRLRARARPRPRPRRWASPCGAATRASSSTACPASRATSASASARSSSRSRAATFPTLISAVFRSCRLIFGRATISKRGCFSRNTRARNAHVEASSRHPFRGPGRAPGPAGRAADAPARLRPDGRPPRPAAGHRLPGPELQGVGLAAGAPGAERERGLLALSLRRPRAKERDGHARAAQARTRTASSGSTRSHPSARGRRRTRAGASSSSTTSTRTTATTRRSAAATRRRASPWTTRTRTRRRRPWTRRRRCARPRTRRRRSRPWSSSACPSTPRGRPRRRRASLRARSSPNSRAPLFVT